MTAYARGDTAAFRELFERYAPMLLRMLLRQLRVREEATDLLQQTFLQLHRARLDFDSGQRFRPWIFTIALNLKREYWRRARRRPESVLDDAALAELGVEARGAKRWEARRDLLHGLAQVRPDQREVIELHWFEGLSFSEIGECLGLTANAVKVRAHRGYVTLRERLGDDLPPLEEGASNRPATAGIDPKSIP